MADEWWAGATKMCSQPDACNRPGTKTCVNMWRARRCECRDGYKNIEVLADGSGGPDDCSTDIDECENPDFCQNGATCKNSHGSFTCHCEQGWTGDNCELDVDECAADTPACLNGGVCTHTEGGFTCECTAQWQGDYCEEDVDECAVAASNDQQICSNDGGCINTQGDFECLCSGGWGGKTCEEDFDECAAALCPLGTVCKHVAQSFTCECPERGCNNLDETEYQNKLSQVYGAAIADEFPSGDSEDDYVAVEGTDSMEVVEEDGSDEFITIEVDDTEATSDSNLVSADAFADNYDNVEINDDIVDNSFYSDDMGVEEADDQPSDDYYDSMK